MMRQVGSAMLLIYLLLTYLLLTYLLLNRARTTARSGDRAAIRPVTGRPVARLL